MKKIDISNSLMYLMLVVNMDNEIKLSRVPKITYLNDEITISLNHLLLEVVNIIMEYFFKCTKCNNYFEEIRQCKDCKHNFCKYCYFKYTQGGYCSNCVNVEIDNNRKLKRYMCFYENCKKRAVNGDENLPYYCRYHSKNKLLVNYTCQCKEQKCMNVSNYMNTSWTAYCGEHKTNDCKLMLVEGCLYKNNNKTKCDECSNKVVILHTCSCGSKRCGKCTKKSSFIYSINKLRIIKCSKCVTAIKFDYDSMYSLTLEQCCDVHTCSEKGTYYNDNGNNYFCKKHKNKDSISITKRCRHNYCCAIRTTKKFCKVHNKEYNLLYAQIDDDAD